jgi:hypothetical protein
LTYGLIATAGEGYSTVQNGLSVAYGAQDIAAGNYVTGGLQLVGGAVGLRGNARAARDLGSGHLHVYRGHRLNTITQDISERVDNAIAAGDVAALQQFDRRGTLAVQAASGSKMARGTVIDYAVKQRASDTFGLRGLHYVEPFEYGPDVYNSATMRGWDITTLGEWAKGFKQTKYVTNPPVGRPQWRTLDPLLTD